MTVKVLEGNEKYTVVKVCHGCRAKLKATTDDMQFSRGDDGDVVFFNCPACGTSIRVPEAPMGVPSVILRRLRT